MKKTIIFILAMFVISCSEDNATEPTVKEYPISHKHLAQDIAIKINQIRRLNGLEEFLYKDDATYLFDGEPTTFNKQTGYEEDDIYNIDDAYELQRNDTIYEFITRGREYYEQSKPLIDQIVGLNGYITERVESGETTIAINIVERENLEPKYNSNNEPNWRYNLQMLDFYVYYMVREY